MNVNKLKRLKQTPSYNNTSRGDHNEVEEDSEIIVSIFILVWKALVSDQAHVRRAFQGTRRNVDDLALKSCR